MNIFFLSYDPKQAAEFLVDKHVNKMILESCQMLANCYSEKMLSREDCPRTKKGTIRKYSYYNHPCSVWVRKSHGNFYWLLKHANAIIEEKKYRDNKRHFCESFVKWCWKNSPDSIEYNSELTLPAQCFSTYGHLKSDSGLFVDIIKAYRKFYTLDKKFDKSGKRMDIWTKRKRPFWWTNDKTRNT